MFEFVEIKETAFILVKKSEFFFKTGLVTVVVDFLEKLGDFLPIKHVISIDVEFSPQ